VKKTPPTPQQPEHDDDLAFSDDEIAALAHSVEPVAPAAAVFDRLLASLDDDTPYLSFLSDVAALCDLARDAARAVLRGIKDPARWAPPFQAGLDLFHIDGGPRVADGICGFVRLAPDQSYPHHSHTGDEVTLVLDGTLVDSSGQTYGPGDRYDMHAGSAHSYRAGPDGLFVLVVGAAIDCGGGDVTTPDDPRA
jgi:hypothetical protein